MATAGLVLGIVALVASVIPIIGAFIAVPCALVGIPLSGVSLSRSKENKGKSIAGIITSSVAVILVVVWFIVFAVTGAFDEDTEGNNEVIIKSNNDSVPTPYSIDEDQVSTIGYRELLRNSTDLQGKKFQFNGIIHEVIELAFGGWDIKVKLQDGVFGNEILYLQNYEWDNRPLEGDGIQFIGESNGTYTQTYFIGDPDTMPKLKAIEVTIIPFN